VSSCHTRSVWFFCTCSLTRRKAVPNGNLEGAVVVTGAGRGFGRAIAEELGHGGAKVVVNYSQSKGPAEDLVARLKQSGSPESVAIGADVSDPAQAARLIEETVKQFGRIDVLVNNAGIMIDRTMKNLSTDDWDKVIQLDLNAYSTPSKRPYPISCSEKAAKSSTSAPRPP